jgi:outer membrane biosynthesis protein TonB
MDTNVNPIKEILGELFSLLESLETQSLAIMQFVKDKGIATDDALKPYLEQAGNASSVKWRAARVRMEYLLSPIEKPKDKEKQPEAQAEKHEEKQPDKQSEKQSEKPADEKSQNESPKANKEPAKKEDNNAGNSADAASADGPKKSSTGQDSNRK